MANGRRVIKISLVSRSNLVEGIDASYISKCLHDPENAPLCPIFKLGDIVKLSGFNFETIARVVRPVFIWTLTLRHTITWWVVIVSRQGGAIGIVVDWTCNLDLDVKHCKPKYDFHGLYGNPSETDKARASVGYNFRSVSASASVQLFLTSRSALCDRTTELSSLLSRHLRDLQRLHTAIYLSTNTAG